MGTRWPSAPTPRTANTSWLWAARRRHDAALTTQIEEWDNKKAGTLDYNPDEIKRRQEDGFYKLQNATVDVQKGEEELPRLAKLLESKVTFPPPPASRQSRLRRQRRLAEDHAGAQKDRSRTGGARTQSPPLRPQEDARRP